MHTDRLPWQYRISKFGNLRHAHVLGAGIHKLVLGFVAVSAGAAIVYSACLLLVGERLLGMLYGNGYVAFTRIVPLLSCSLILITASQGVQLGLRAMNAPCHVFVAFLI